MMDKGRPLLGEVRGNEDPREVYKNLEAVLKKRMPIGDHSELINFIQEKMGFDFIFLDNLLFARERNIFYMLQEHDIVDTTREEVTLLRGKYYRLYYWVMKVKTLETEAKTEPIIIRKNTSIQQIYDDMPDEVWSRG